MGIRYEHQQTDYYEKGIRIDAQSPTYNDIIPVLAASWSHNGKSFSLSYRLRKNNPDYSLLTNSIRYRSKYEYSQGNPLLKTQKTHRFSAGASWNWLYFSAYFSRILNMYTNIIMPYKEDTHPASSYLPHRPFLQPIITALVSMPLPNWGVGNRNSM